MSLTCKAGIYSKRGSLINDFESFFGDSIFPLSKTSINSTLDEYDMIEFKRVMERLNLCHLLIDCEDLEELEVMALGMMLNYSDCEKLKSITLLNANENIRKRIELINKCTSIDKDKKIKAFCKNKSIEKIIHNIEKIELRLQTH